MSKLEELAEKITKLISDYNLDSDVAIYFGGKRLDCFSTNDEDDWIEVEEVKGSEYCQYANDDTITMTFEGPLYDAINYGGYGEFMKKLDKLISDYGYYYELGNAWNLALYKL